MYTDLANKYARMFDIVAEAMVEDWIALQYVNKWYSHSRSHEQKWKV